MVWLIISKSQGKIELRIGIHIGDVENDDGPPPDVFGYTVNIAARIEFVAEAGDVVISAATYLCLGQNRAAPFNNCDQQTLKNIARPVEIWSCGRLNVSSKGMAHEIWSFSIAGPDYPVYAVRWVISTQRSTNRNKERDMTTIKTIVVDSL